MASRKDNAELAIIVLSSIAAVCHCLSALLKLCQEYRNPKLWKYSLLFTNISHILLTIGLVLFYVNLLVSSDSVCKAAGFFILFGVTECLLSLLTNGIILIAIQHPGKSTTLSSFHRNLVLFIIIPEVILGAGLSYIPYTSDNLFDTSNISAIQCFPIQDLGGEQGSLYGLILVIIWWVTIVAVILIQVILGLKLWKFNNRINSAHLNVWQAQLLSQGKTHVKFLISVTVIFVCVLVSLTFSVYSKSSLITDNNVWIAITSMALAAILNGVLSNVSDVMWSSCCCRGGNAVEEPHRKLKKLELLKIEGAGRLRMKATWSIGKHATKRGLMKVYGLNHLKAWAQEIVILGMLRRAQHPSLLQCLWTNSSNPYYETMTLISGEIITSDSRIICLELTNGGSLQTFLQKAELPLPEPCQRMIIHDIAEGLFYLHHENVLHSNLTSSCIYLKGSLQRWSYRNRTSMVLRAAVGDFESAHIYGSLQQNMDESIKDKRYFFLPDIRAFALIALEVVSKMCEKKFQNRYTNYNSEQVPLQLNLEHVISDEEDEFEAQYCYDAEDTHRMFDSLHTDEYVAKRCLSPESFGQPVRNNSLDNLFDRDRPTSPNYSDMQRYGSKSPDTVSESEIDDEVAKYSTPEVQEKERNGPFNKHTEIKPERCKSPESKQPERRIISKRKSRKEMSKSADRAMTPIVGKQSHSRSMSPSQLKKALEHGRCVSPDPMNDEMLKELRKETKEGAKAFKKERKFSFSRKKSEEKIPVPQKLEAFVTKADETKKKDGKWLSKPTSILKSITSNDTAVSVFKAKPTDDNGFLDAIEEEDSNAPTQSIPKSKPKSKHMKEKTKINEVWDIIDEQYYTQVNKKANTMLRKTVSGESRSSLWSFISTPEDMDDEDLDDILDCLPGMTDPADLRKSEITVNDIMSATLNAKTKDAEKKRFSYKDLPESKFELIDYYELLKSKQITIHDVPEDKREMLINVVEMKREEKLRREGKLSNGGAIANDAMYDNGMNPGYLNDANNNEKGGKVKIVSFRQGGSQVPSYNSTPKNQVPDPRLERARSAPLKRPRTPMHKTMTTEKPPPEINPIFMENKTSSVSTLAKRNKARSALKRALNNKGQNTGARHDTNRGLTQANDLNVKYATVKRINVSGVSKSEGETSPDHEEVIVVPVPTSESFSVTKPIQPKSADISRFHSFSSNESGSSIASSVRVKNADVSLTSGELSSLSSQAESDHYETDGHMTDIEGPSKNALSDKNKQFKRPSSKVDSGFDSGSVSSGMSTGHANTRSQKFVSTQGHSNRGVGSWARNYKMKEPISNSPAYFGAKFLPHESLPEEQFGTNGYENQRMSSVESEHAFEINDNDSGINVNTKSNLKESYKSNRTNTQPVSQRNFINTDTSLVLAPDSKYTSINTRPMSPPSRVMSPTSLSDKSRPMSPNVKPTNRPMSPNVQPTNIPMSPNVQPTNRPMSPHARVMSPTPRSMSAHRPMSPQSRPMSPNVQPTENRGSSKTHNPPRPMSPLAKPNVASRPTSLSPTRDGHRPRTLSPINRRSKSNDHYKNEKTKNEDRIGIGSSGDTAAGIASKRYRELVKQGVPLRATAIDSGEDRMEEVRTPGIVVRPGTAESTLEEPVDDQTLFADLESKGFFNTRSRSPSPHKGSSPKRNLKSEVNSGKDAKQKESRRKRNKKIPLDQIIRENPEGKPARKPFRSTSNQHLTVSEDAFLNQPTSEDSETCSIKTNKSNSSTPSGSRPKVMVDAEMVIDRIFSQSSPPDYELDVEVEAALGLDKDPFKSLPEMYGNFKEKDRIPNLDTIPLLNGVDDKHIHGCMELAASLHVITVRDLLPASKDNFTVLRNKLQQVGQLGTVGNQLLDVIANCWLLDMPPTSGDLVEQLTDPVTETEV